MRFRRLQPGLELRKPARAPMGPRDLECVRCGRMVLLERTIVDPLGHPYCDPCRKSLDELPAHHPDSPHYRFISILAALQEGYAIEAAERQARIEEALA